MPSPTDELLEQSFQLAYFIHGQKDIAICVAQDAMLRLEAIVVAQDKRRYYAATTRTKVSTSELHTLQRITYIVSNPYEREQEQAQNHFALDEEDMIIRFIKHLVQITIKRNSFYVTLGLSRLLHTYTTPEAMAMYDVVSQDPNRPKDDDYYRECKKKLIEEMEERFAGLVKIVRGLRGETRFESLAAPRQRTELCRECLSRFTPWKTSCAIPHQFNPLVDKLHSLSVASTDADDQHPIEMKRIHTLLHPDCFSQLVAALNLQTPDQQLEIPRFSLAHRDSNPPNPPKNRRATPKLSEAELAAIRDLLAEQAARRKSLSAGFLSMVVDGVEQVRWDVRRSTRVQLEVKPNANLIEVRARQASDDVLLAAYLLTYNDDPATTHQPAVASITLEGGQKISFTIAFAKDATGVITKAEVGITYQETNLERAASLLWQRLKYRFAEMRQLLKGRLAPILKPALTFTLLAALLAAIAWFIQSKFTVKESSVIVQQPSPVPTPTPAPRDEIGRPTQETPPPAPPNEIAQTPRADNGDIVLREQLERPAESLLAIKRIYIYPLGDDPFSQQVRDSLINQLEASERFIVTETLETAEASLKGISQHVTTQVDEVSGQEVSLGHVTVRLVNANGDVIWRLPKKNSRGRSLAPAKAVAAQVVKELLDHIQQLERRREKAVKGVTR